MYSENAVFMGSLLVFDTYKNIVHILPQNARLLGGESLFDGFIFDSLLCSTSIHAFQISEHFSRSSVLSCSLILGHSFLLNVA